MCKLIVLLVAVAVAAAAPNVAPVPSPAPTIIDVYRAPLDAKEFLQPEEETGLEYLYDQPFVVAFQKSEHEVSAYFLQNGVQTIYENEKMEFLRKHLLSSVDKVALYMSAARYLSIPHLTMPIKMAVSPAAKPIDSKYSANLDPNTADGEFIPFVFIVRKEMVQKDLMKLYKVGQFSFTEDKVQSLP
ncbi:Outer membrane protein A [Frankliniella fusca]|uniref:Outer membrane protein A n=1 Tax=Frankliniella fusca TaxID=407009 RepID=A0AAE1HX27_9NEOP|nr:Outer membrane protein A [Frankliniella fusca]